MIRLRADQLGQFFLVRLGDCRSSERLVRELVRAAPAGVVLPDELPRSMEATSQFLIRMASALPVRSFLALREEGGAHDPLSRFLPPLPSPGAAADAGLGRVTELGEFVGEALSLLGINTNFAPRLDLSASAAGKAPESETFGPDPGFIAECGKAFIDGLEKFRVEACCKHFPGLGSVVQSRGALPTSAKPMAALWHEDLVPFRKLLPRLHMVLVGAARYKAYDFDPMRPACFSSALVTGLLREKLGYHGLAVAYDLESGQNVGQAVVRAIDAGCDLLIVDEGKPLEDALQGLKSGIEAGGVSLDCIDQSLKRIHSAMRRLAPRSGKVPALAWKRLIGRYEAFARKFAEV